MLLEDDISNLDELAKAGNDQAFLNELGKHWHELVRLAKLGADRYWKEANAEMADGCLSMIYDHLLMRGCCHDKKVMEGTPAMFYPEMIDCVIARHVERAKKKLRKQMKNQERRKNQ